MQGKTGYEVQMILLVKHLDREFFRARSVGNG